jgi:hypothetical protein
MVQPKNPRAKITFLYLKLNFYQAFCQDGHPSLSECFAVKNIESEKTYENIILQVLFNLNWLKIFLYVEIFSSFKIVLVFSTQV